MVAHMIIQAVLRIGSFTNSSDISIRADREGLAILYEEVKDRTRKLYCRALAKVLHIIVSKVRKANPLIWCTINIHPEERAFAIISSTAKPRTQTRPRLVSVAKAHRIKPNL